jgi:thiol-disulfide isomerase/thioredoxin
MKKVLVAVLIANTALAFGQKQKNLDLQVEFADKNIKKIALKDGHDEVIKNMNINSQGLFKASVRLKDPCCYQISYGQKRKALYVENDANLLIKVAKDQSIKYTGSLAKENEYSDNLTNDLSLEKQRALLSIASKEEFDEKFQKLSDNEKKRLNEAKLSPKFKDNIKSMLSYQLRLIDYTYNIDKLKNATLPSFDFENNQGGTSKPSDFIGKYVYIDLWTTWCEPCLAEVPSIQALEKKYHGKNIQFIGVSLDEGRAHDNCKKTIKDKNMAGIQLLSNQGPEGKFAKDIALLGLPRFILVGPDGKIIEPEALRPSDPKLQEQLDKLLN